MADTKTTTTEDDVKKAGKAAETAVKPDTKANDDAAKFDEKPAKGGKPVVTTDEPFPTQADLDAIKEGRFNREITGENDGLQYKTR